MIAFPYDSAFDPPAPICEITLSVQSTGRRISTTAMIDTGADASLVPVSHLNQIAARRVFEATLRSQWGERRRVYLYLVDLQVADLTLPGVYVVGDELGNETILGRDVLNRLRLLLDGRNQLTQLLE